MKRRNISGIYLMYKFEDESEKTPTCFEDCPKEKQDEWLDSLDPETLKNLARMLADTLNEISNKVGVTRS